jgi:hypothetical protein
MTVVVSKGHNWAKIKQDAKDGIDRRAEWARGKYHTTVHGQDYVYQEKYREAKEYLAATPENRNPADFPFLHAETQIDKCSMVTAAQNIMNKRQRHHERFATIEVIRRMAKKKIDEAPNKKTIIDQIVFETNFGFPPEF